MGVLMRIQWPPRSVVRKSVPAFPANQQMRGEGAKPAVISTFAPVSSNFHFLPPSVVNWTVPAGCSFQKTLGSGVRFRPASERATWTSSLETPCFIIMVSVRPFNGAACVSTMTVSVTEGGTLFASEWAGVLWAATPPALRPKAGGAGAGGGGGAEATAGAFSETTVSVGAGLGIFGEAEGDEGVFFSRRPPTS